MITYTVNTVKPKDRVAIRLIANGTLDINDRPFRRYSLEHSPYGEALRQIFKELPDAIVSFSTPTGGTIQFRRGWKNVQRSPVVSYGGATAETTFVNVSARPRRKK